MNGLPYIEISAAMMGVLGTLLQAVNIAIALPINTSFFMIN